MCQEQAFVFWPDSVIHLSRMCVYLVCAATVSLAASTAPRAASATGDIRLRTGLGSRTDTLHPSVGFTSGRTDAHVNPSIDLLSQGENTAGRSRKQHSSTSHRHHHNRRNSRHSTMGEQRIGITDVSSNAANLGPTTGANIKVRQDLPGHRDAVDFTSTPGRPIGADNDRITEVRSLCPHCGVGSEGTDGDIMQATTDDQLNREEIVKIRIEAVKQQILDKLRLSRPPQVNVSDLHIPAPMYELADFDNEGRGSSSRQGDTLQGSRGEDDYYGRTTKIIIQAEQGRTPCWTNAHGGRCFTFQFSSANTNNNIQSAHLWVYWNGSVFVDSPTSRVNLTVEGEPSFSNAGFSPITTSDLTDVTKAGWLTFDLKFVVRRWHRHNHENHLIQVTCNENCAEIEDMIQAALSPHSDGGLAPFIIMHTAKNKRNSRVRRSNDCTFVGSSECCKESLRIRFSDIGWDWVLMPVSFEANYCRGTCRLSTSIGSRGAQNIHAHRHREMERRGISFETCCAPRIMSPLSLYYFDTKNNEYIHAEIPDMIIDSCGCSF